MGGSLMPTDLFERPDELPEEVQQIINEFQDQTYEECEKLLHELEKVGFTFDYYLDAVPCNLRKIHESRN